MTQPANTAVSRRTALASAFAASAGDDATLMGLCAEFWLAHMQIWTADYLAEHEPGSPEQKRLEAILDQLSKQEYGLMKQISQTPARSQLGLKGKADILLAVLPEVMRDCYLAEDSAELLLVMSLLQDMTGITQI